MAVTELGDRAVVLGASMAGLLAARVLAEHYRTVTVVERDVCPHGPANRRGVPQARHAHALLARGAQILDELFPGILQELVADGAPVWDDGDMTRFHMCIGGHLLCCTGYAEGFDPALHSLYSPSRPLLEAHVRQRVKALGNVTVLEGCDVVELTSTDDHRRITGVRVVDRDSGAASELAADLVVDAMGRAAHTPAALDALGYGRPVEEHITVHTVYVSQALRIPPGAIHETLIAIPPVPDRPTGMFLASNENDVWMLTVFGMVGHEPPRDLAGILDFVAAFAPPKFLAAIRSGEPQAPVVQHRLPSSQWRRYDKMRRFPDGLLVCGDAMCSFNPIYGQGMTVAALEAVALKEALRHGTTELTRRYFGSAATSIRAAWNLAAGSDLTFPEVEGNRAPGMRVINRFVDWVLTAAEHDPVVVRQFIRVTGLLDPPTRLFNPAFVLRVAAVNMRHRRRHSPQPTERSTVVQSPGIS